MKILTTVQNNFAILGINLNHHDPFNYKKSLVIFVFGTSITLNYISIFRAHTLKEYSDSIHMAMALTLGSALFGIALFERTKISELIESFERIIIDSEYILKCHNIICLCPIRKL